MGDQHKTVAYIILFILLCGTLTWRVYGAPPTIQVDPPSVVATLGAQIQVNVSIVAVTNLTAWQFRLFFNSTVLNCTGVSEGPFLQSAGITFFTWNINNAYNATHGCILVGCSLTGQTSSASGNGALANITFSTLTPGSTILHLANTELDDNNFPPNQIPSTNQDGTVQVGIPDHDVAVTGVLSPKTVVCLGYCSNVIVTVRNVGANVETFLVLAYANSSSVTSTPALVDHLASLGSANVTFVWNTTGFVSGRYILSAFAEPVPGESNTANNNFTGGTIIVSKLIGDITGGTPNLLDFVPDGKVDMKDVSVVAKYFGQNAPPAPSNCDLTGPTPSVPDGKVDMRDVATAAKHFGEKA